MNHSKHSHGIKSVGLAAIVVLLLGDIRPVNRQDLEPGAYSVSPVGINIALFSYSPPLGI
jgi:hypothetical protein